ncbi:MAG: ExeM/NucH family extracellular endonuclease, partial [Thiomargarita sp.]|nr:ExeM/NucH family extracellular endonuclease [Thiomargarita sp.]
MKKKYDLRKNMKRLTKNIINLFLLTSNSVLATPVFINEIHYDNIGTDTGEAIEIFGPANTDMTNWRIIRYNGNNQAVYTTPSAEPSGSDTLSGTIPDMGNGYGVIIVNYNGLQNDMDGIALINNANTVIQFLSYEGIFTASGGAANGRTSTDIGVAESNTSTPIGHSLQLIGTGTNYEDFTWNTAIANTFGRLNTGQALPSNPSDILINEIVTDPQQDWSTNGFTDEIGNGNVSNIDEWVELYIATAGLNLTDWTIELNDGSDISSDLTNSGAFQVSNYIAFNGGKFTNTAEGDYLVLGNVKGSGAMNNDITIVLKDPTTIIIDEVQIGGGGAPDGNSTGVADEAVARLPNATDTNNNANDFNKMTATIGSTNNGCGSNATKIHTIQGNGATSLEDGNTHTIEAVVVGDFQADNQLKGFFVQEEDSNVDGDSLTSEGIFVYNPNGTDVSVGDVVRVTGEVDEFHELTELKNISNVTICNSGATVTPATINLPFAAASFLERFEGMSVNLPQTLTVSDNYNLGRYGQFTLSNGRLFNPTNVREPGTAANALQAQNDLNRIIIDDGSTATHPEPIITPSPQLSATNTLRNGNTVTGITGVLTYRFSKYGIHPTSTPTFTANPRLATPASVGGTLKVASFNVLNYFNGDGDGDSGFPTSRGADTASEFTRQRDKIICAIVAMGADIVGLMEMENDGYGTNSAIQDLVNGLNAAAPAGTTYTFIHPDFGLGSDEIKVALIYRVETVTPVNLPATTTSPPFNSRRPPLAQTFRENSSAGQMTVVVNHFKAKGSCPSDGSLNENKNDGQSCWNAERIQAANTLTNWLASDPTSGGDNILIIGDINAYAKEEPITAIKNAGYTDLVETFIGANAYSYVYKGQAGYLDHAFASASLTSKVIGITEWHINADEPKAIDYNEESKSTGQLTNLYNADPYRASDHDPLIIGFELPNHASIIITPTSGSNVTEGGATDSFDVVLNTQPTNEVTITVSPDSQTTVDKETLTFTDGHWNTVQTVEVTAVDDSTVENNHSSTISLSASSVDANYDGATFVVNGTEASSLSVNITDNDFAPPIIPNVELSVSANAGTEAATTAITVTATASSAVSGNQTVNLAVTGVNASDYTLSGTTISIANGETTGTVTFTIADDGDVEGTETATLTISSPSAGITLGSTTTQN